MVLCVSSPYIFQIYKPFPMVNLCSWCRVCLLNSSDRHHPEDKDAYLLLTTTTIPSSTIGRGCWSRMGLEGIRIKRGFWQQKKIFRPWTVKEDENWQKIFAIYEFGWFSGTLATCSSKPCANLIYKSVSPGGWGGDVPFPESLDVVLAERAEWV